MLLIGAGVDYDTVKDPRHLAAASDDQAVSGKPVQHLAALVAVPGAPASSACVSLRNLSDTQVTGVGLKELAGLKNLTSLLLPNMKVTNKGLNLPRDHQDQ